MLDGLRVSLARDFARHLKLSSDLAEVSDIVLDLEFFWICSPSEHDMHPLWLETLDS